MLLTSILSPNFADIPATIGSLIERTNKVTFMPVGASEVLCFELNILPWERLMPSSRTARPTRHTRPKRTARRLLKVAGLGVAGLIAGLLAGCSASKMHLFSQLQEERTLTASRRVENPEAKRVPAFRHAPTPHYTQPNQPAAHRATAVVGGGHGVYTTAQYNPDSADIFGQ